MLKNLEEKEKNIIDYEYTKRIWKILELNEMLTNWITRGVRNLFGPCTHLPALTLKPAHPFLSPLKLVFRKEKKIRYLIQIIIKGK